MADSGRNWEKSSGGETSGESVQPKSGHWDIGGHCFRKRITVWMAPTVTDGSWRTVFTRPSHPGQYFVCCCRCPASALDSPHAVPTAPRLSAHSEPGPATQRHPLEAVLRSRTRRFVPQEPAGQGPLPTSCFLLHKGVSAGTPVLAAPFPRQVVGAAQLSSEVTHPLFLPSPSFPP